MDKRTGIIYNHSFDCIKKVITKEGIRALYGGFGLNGCKIIISSALQIFILKEIKNRKL